MKLRASFGRLGGKVLGPLIAVGLTLLLERDALANAEDEKEVVAILVGYKSSAELGELFMEEVVIPAVKDFEQRRGDLNNEFDSRFDWILKERPR